MLKEVQIGSSRADALRALAERTDVEDLRIFITSMVQAEKLGMPIAEVLRVQAARDAGQAIPADRGGGEQAARSR